LHEQGEIAFQNPDMCHKIKYIIEKCEKEGRDKKIFYIGNAVQSRPHAILIRIETPLQQ
jgi:hypothetical protein